MKKIGILGGTFNPPHMGHIALAKKALHDFGLEYVIFVPAGIPPHKKNIDIASKTDRLQMTKLAIKGNDKLKISKIEINRKGYSYAVDTFRKFKKRCGKDCELYYIMGLDSINTILEWKKPLELLKLCKFIIATRSGSKIRTLRRIMKFPPLQMSEDKIMIIEMNMDISSSEIRQKIKDGKSTDKIVQKAVIKYIENKGLYNK